MHLTSKLNIYQAVRAACLQHQPYREDLSEFGTAFDRFSAKLSQLEQAAYLHDMLMLGVTPARDQILRRIIEQADLVANTLRAYAAATDDEILSEKVSFPKSAFLQHGNRHLVGLVDGMVEAAAEHCPSLKDHEAWQNHVGKLLALKQELVAAIDASAVETGTLPLLVDELDLLLDECDRAITRLAPGSALQEQFNAARIRERIG